MAAHSPRKPLRSQEGCNTSFPTLRDVRIQDNLLIAKTGRHVGMGTTPGSLRRVDTSPTDTSPAAGEVLGTSSSGKSAAAMYPAVRDMAGTAEKDFVPSAG